METLYIHEKTGNIQPMTEATWEILGGEKSGWKVATDEQIEEAGKKADLEKPKALMVELPKVAPKTEKVAGTEEVAKIDTGDGSPSIEPVVGTQTPKVEAKKPAEPKVLTAEEAAKA